MTAEQRRATARRLNRVCAELQRSGFSTLLVELNRFLSFEDAQRYATQQATWTLKQHAAFADAVARVDSSVET